MEAKNETELALWEEELKAFHIDMARIEKAEDSELWQAMDDLNWYDLSVGWAIARRNLRLDQIEDWAIWLRYDKEYTADE